MKKVLIGLGVALVLLLVVIFSAPFFIDLNKYRPQIISEVEKHMNAEFQLGSIALRGLGIRLADVSLSSKGDFDHKGVISVGAASVRLSLLSLLAFRPEATIYLKNPNITVVKNAKGEINLAALPKRSKSTTEVQQKEKQSPSKSVALPAFLLGANLSFVAEDAALKYLDEKTEATHAIDSLQVSLKNISFNRPIDFSISAHVATGSKEDPLFSGGLSLDGKAKVRVGKKQNISGLELDATFSIGEFLATVKGEISDLDTLATDLNIHTPVLSIGKLKNSFGPLKNYAVDGDLSIKGTVKGRLKEFSQCRVNATVHVNVKAEETELTFRSTLSETLDSLKSQFVLEAASINVDAILPKKRAAFFLAVPVVMAATVKNDSLASLRNNPILKGLTADGRVDIKKIIFRKATISDVNGHFSIKNLTFALSRFALKAFGGKASLKGDVSLRHPKPTYGLTTVIQGLQMNPLVTTASPVLKNTVFGTFQGNLRLQGKGLSMAEAKTYLTGTGKVDLKDLELKGLNMGKALQEQLKLIEIFGGSDVLNKQFDGKFEYMRSSIQIKKGKLFTPDAELKAPGYGATLQGYASFDKEIDYKGKVLLPAKEFKSRSIASLADSKGMVGFPFTLEGVLPNFTFSVDPSAVVRMAAKAQVESKVKEKIKEKIGIDLPIDLPF